MKGYTFSNRSARTKSICEKNSTLSHVLTSYSWSYSTTTGRSSDLDLFAFLRLLKVCPSDNFNDFPTDSPDIKMKINRGEKLLPYSDEFVQDFHLLPFSPDLKRLFLNPTPVMLLYFLYALKSVPHS